MGGETRAPLLFRTGADGPSPRGRGNRGRGDSGDDGEGSIPAWAGKPRAWTICGQVLMVHPRVGGETRIDSNA